MTQQPDRKRSASSLKRWSLVAVGLVAFVLVPFALFGSAVEGWATEVLQSQSAKAATLVLGVGLLSADIVLPIPSSFVLTLLGVVLGQGAGTLAGAAGLTLGCIVGYGLGRFAGQIGDRWGVAGAGGGSVHRLLERYGLVFLVACRAVPVLAEASIIAAGLAGLPPGRTLVATGLANIGVAAVYATLGTWAADASMHAAAFAAALAVPALALAAAAAIRRASGGGAPAP